jgi:hypothetical protein
VVVFELGTAGEAPGFRDAPGSHRGVGRRAFATQRPGDLDEAVTVGSEQIAASVTVTVAIS